MQLFAVLESEQGCMAACLSPVLTYIRQRFKTVIKLIDAEEIRNLMLVLRVFTLKDSAAYVRKSLMFFFLNKIHVYMLFDLLVYFQQRDMFELTY